MQQFQLLLYCCVLLLKLEVDIILVQIRLPFITFYDINCMDLSSFVTPSQHNVDYTNLCNNNEEQVIYCKEENMISYHVSFFKKNVKDELAEQVY